MNLSQRLPTSYHLSVSNIRNKIHNSIMNLHSSQFTIYLTICPLKFLFGRVITKVKRLIILRPCYGLQVRVIFYIYFKIQKGNGPIHFVFVRVFRVDSLISPFAVHFRVATPPNNRKEKRRKKERDFLLFH